MKRELTVNQTQVCSANQPCNITPRIFFEGAVLKLAYFSTFKSKRITKAETEPNGVRHVSTLMTFIRECIRERNGSSLQLCTEVARHRIPLQFCFVFFLCWFVYFFCFFHSHQICFHLKLWRQTIVSNKTSIFCHLSQCNAHRFVSLFYFRPFVAICR